MEDAVEDGHPENAEVEPRSPVGDVVEIVLDSFAQGGVAAPAVDLGPAGDPGLHAMAGHVIGNGLGELLNKDGSLRPGTDQAHVAYQNIDQLRQLVKACASNECAE